MVITSTHYGIDPSTQGTREVIDKDQVREIIERLVPKWAAEAEAALKSYGYGPFDNGGRIEAEDDLYLAVHENICAEYWRHVEEGI